MVEFENSSSMAVSAEGSVSSSGELPTIPPVTVEKKKRNLPGMPDPDAEVIAMSPKSLLATNRFVCEICNKGFQRDQNLQLHRRGHNLPWKLRQRAGNEVRKRVYVCPELTCVHHDPKRALGDLTGIKKHYCRKHGEKKWKCERCAKKYAVQSDWKAHLKTCGTREYRCDCGTLFSRRDSFITHRAFCDALAQESSRAQTLAVADSEETLTVQTVASSSSSPPQPPPTPSTGVLSPVLSIQSSEVPENLPGQLVHQQPFAASSTTPAATITNGSSSTTGGGNGLNSGSGGVFASIFASSAPPGFSQPSQSPSSFSDMLCAMAGPDPYSSEPMLLSLSSSSLYLSTNPSLFPNTDQDHHHPCPPQPALSATALLQKAAQMGATGSGSFLRGLGLELSSSSNNLVKSENISIESGLGLGLPTAGSSHLLGPSSLYGAEPTTLDLLGMGMGGGGASTAGFSALLTSIGGGLDVAAATATAFRVNSNGDSWEGPSERKPSLL